MVRENVGPSLQLLMPIFLSLLLKIQISKPLGKCYLLKNGLGQDPKRTQLHAHEPHSQSMHFFPQTVPSFMGLYFFLHSKQLYPHDHLPNKIFFPKGYAEWAVLHMLFLFL